LAIRIRSQQQPSPDKGAKVDAGAKAKASLQVPVTRPQTDPAQTRFLDVQATDFAAAQQTEEQTASGLRNSPISVRADLLAGKDSTADPAIRRSVDNTYSDVNSVYLYTAPPSAPDPIAPSAGHLDIGVEERTASSSIGLPSADREVRIASSLDRWGTSFNFSDLRANREHTTGTYIAKDFVSVSTRYRREFDGGARGVGGGLFYEPGGGGVTGSLAFKNADGLTLGIGGFGGGSIIRHIVDHGDYRGHDPALQDTRTVELRRTLSGYAVGLPGLSATLGLSGRLGISRKKAVSYRTHVDRERAREMLFEDGNRITRSLRDRGRALGLVNEPLPLPDLSRLDQLKVGDQIELTTDGSLSGGAVVGCVPLAYVGVQGTARGEFVLNVERTSQDELRVALVPTDVRTVQVSGRSVVLDVTAARASAKALARSYTFDLRQPAAVAAYQALLKGELPGGGKARSTRAIPADSALPELEELPTGVNRTSFEWIRGSTLRFHGDIGFALLQLGVTAHSARFERGASDGKSRVDELTRSTEISRTVPLSGDETRGVRASLLRSTRFDDDGTPHSAFSGLRLITYLSDTKARGLEPNRDIRAINNAFGTHIDPFHEPSLKNARSFEVECWLGPEELERLAGLAEAELRQAAAAAGTRAAPLLVLAETLRAAPDAQHQAEAVLEYVGSHGYQAAGALARLLGNELVAVSTTNGDLEALLAEATTLRFKYEQPIELADAQALVQRFSEVEKLDAKLVKLRALVADDPLLADDERQRGLDRVDAAGRDLQQTLSLERLDDGQRRSLIDQLNSGWVSARDVRLIDRLEHYR